MRIGGLCSGIGGLELGLERAGVGETVWQVERDGYCRSVLAHHWPGATRSEDITTTDWSTVEHVDIVCGGIPCQPFSYGGNRGGTDDERWIWPAAVECLRVVRPDYFILENVAALLTDDSDAFGMVLADLSALGFDAEWSVVSACSVGAPHTRDRVFVLAYRTGADVSGQVSPDRRQAEGSREPRGSRRSTRGDGWLPEPPMDRVAHGVPSRLVRDPLHALGNAVVPAVAEAVGRQLMAHVLERAA